MNERPLADDALADQLRRFYQDVYEPIEPVGQVWKKLESQLEVASPPRKSALTTLLPSQPGSTPPRTLSQSGGMKHRLGAAVAVLLTGIIILASFALFHMVQFTPISPGVATPAYSTANVPVTPVATVGPQNKYVYNIVTVTPPPNDGFGMNYATSHFPANSIVTVLCFVHGIRKGQKHTISIHWFDDGQELALTDEHVSQVVDSNQIVFFTLTYPEPGLGMAKVFFDLPSSDNGHQANDPYLAGQIYFAIDPANVGTATPG